MHNAEERVHKRVNTEMLEISADKNAILSHPFFVWRGVEVGGKGGREYLQTVQ